MRECPVALTRLPARPPAATPMPARKGAMLLVLGLLAAPALVQAGAPGPRPAGQPKQSYESVPKPMGEVRAVALSHDLMQVAFVWGDPMEFGDKVWHDRQSGPRYHRITGAHFSPDGKRLAYAATTAQEKMLLVVDGVAGKPYDEVLVPPLFSCFSPNGKRVAYTAMQGRQHVVVVDGQESSPYDLAHPPEFSADGGHVAYVARAGGKVVVVLDGQAVDTGSDPDPGRPMPRFVLSSEGRLAAHTAFVQGKELVVAGGVRGPAGDHVGGLLLSPDGKRLAYDLKQGGSYRVVLDGQERGPYAAPPGWQSFSADGSRYAYIASRGGQTLLVVDGKEIADGQEPVFSPDGKRLAYVSGREGQQRVVLDGKEGPAHEKVRRLVFSADGRKLACVVRREGQERLLVDGREIAALDHIGDILFSPNGKHVGYTGRLAQAWHVGLDGHWSDGADAILGVWSRIAFDPQNQLLAVVRQGQHFYRLRLDVTPAL